VVADGIWSIATTKYQSTEKIKHNA
jgi:hypothetical protein